MVAKITAAVNTMEGGQRLIRFNELRQLTGLSRSTLWRLEMAGGFVPRYQFGNGHSIGWLKGDVLKWVSGRKVEMCPIDREGNHGRT